MKKHTNFGPLLIAFISRNDYYSSCLKDFGEEQLAEEKETLKRYISDNDITESPTSSGMYYIETLLGTGLAPVAGDSLWVHFTGKFLNETVFQTTDDGPPFIFQFGVGSVLQG